MTTSQRRVPVASRSRPSRVPVASRPLPSRVPVASRSRPQLRLIGEYSASCWIDAVPSSFPFRSLPFPPFPFPSLRFGELLHDSVPQQLSVFGRHAHHHEHDRELLLAHREDLLPVVVAVALEIGAVLLQLELCEMGADLLHAAAAGDISTSRSPNSAAADIVLVKAFFCSAASAGPRHVPLPCFCCAAVPFLYQRRQRSSAAPIRSSSATNSSTTCSTLCDIAPGCAPPAAARRWSQTVDEAAVPQSRVAACKR
eukprot:CAMPEP_0119397996 /NCGR_PEP_ID=MMETSP1334-20130426/140617_1 /TAXON_ID=127549 /ORGANISM="Calcidiscus leptoporus, Strain RCC1130" /LENGTH=254 /DNA_ID=CAMNT_0007421847 /DNA_START=502 /DNA_END=1263 /DNA_ORIENTATION=-